MTAAPSLVKAGIAERDVTPLSTRDVEHLDRLAAIVRQSKRRADEAIADLAAVGGTLPSPALVAEAMDRHQRAASDYSADAKAFFHVYETTRGRR